MKRTATIALLFCLAVFAGDKKPPKGVVDDETVTIAGTILDAEQIRVVGDDFNNQYTVVEVHITPKGMPFDVRLDNFILRSQSDGDHSAPLVAAQIAGSGELVVKRKYADKSSPNNPNLIVGSSVEMKNVAGEDSVLEALKKKILEEKVTADPETGWLFFPLSKEKPKNLVLSCTTPKSKLRMQFK